MIFISHSTEDKPAALDLYRRLTFVLEKLYKNAADDKLIELAEYQAMGGMEGAVRQTVERMTSGDNITQSAPTSRDLITSSVKCTPLVAASETST